MAETSDVILGLTSAATGDLNNVGLLKSLHNLMNLGRGGGEGEGEGGRWEEQGARVFVKSSREWCCVSELLQLM